MTEKPTADGKKLHILLVEDDPIDAYMMGKFLKRAQIQYDVTHLTDGEEALNFLFRKKGYENAARPDVVLLDINLPSLNGREILKKIRSQKSLNHIPVVVVSGEEFDKDPVKEFGLYENCYTKKWLDMQDLLAIVKAAEDSKATVE